MKLTLHSVGTKNPSITLLTRGFLIGAIVLSILPAIFLSSYPVGAATWNIQSQGDCSGSSPKGASWLSWDGYSSSDSGQTYGFLMYWNGSSWNTQSTGYGNGAGSSGSALANTGATYIGGTWMEEGQHNASFFSGAQYSFGNQFTC
jgi:hypothetical protein